MGRIDLQRYAASGVEIREMPGRTLGKYFNATQLAEALGKHAMTIHIYSRDGRLTPDFVTKNALFFKKSRLEEIKKLWPTRPTKSPDWEPVVGVITPFGMMLPRVRPDAEVLKRLIQLRPKRASRDSSWRTRRRYNLKDLTP